MFLYSAITTTVQRTIYSSATKTIGSRSNATLSKRRLVTYTKGYFLSTVSSFDGLATITPQTTRYRAHQHKAYGGSSEKIANT